MPPIKKPKGAKKTKKHRKHGRVKDRPSHATQPQRTARNKAKRMLHQEQLAGRPLSWQKANEASLSALTLMRAAARKAGLNA